MSGTVNTKIEQNLGPVTAYGYAVANGYTGTEEQFGNEMASVKSSANAAAASAAEAAQYTSGAVGTWLAANMSNPDSPPLDRSLSQQLAAAPADMVGNLKSAINDTNNMIVDLAEDGEVTVLNPANMFPDPTFAKGLWGAVNGTLTIQNNGNDLSKKCLLTRINTGSSGYLAIIMPVSAFENGKTYRVSVNLLKDATSFKLAVLQNTNGTIRSTMSWILSDVNMTNDFHSQSLSKFHYDWTVDTSAFGSYSYVQIQFKCTNDDNWFTEPFIGLASRETSYTIKYTLPEYTEMLEPINLFKGEFYADHYYGGSGYAQQANYCCAKPQLLQAGSYLCNINKQYFGTSLTNKVFEFAGADGTTGQGNAITVTLLQEYTSNGIAHGVYTFTIAEEKYVGINIGYGADDPKAFMLVKGSTISDWPESYLYYFAPYQVVAEPSKLNELMMGQVSPIFGKKVAVNGDSICAGAGELGGFMKPIAGHNNMICSNIAVSGGTLASGTTYSGGGNRHWISTTIKDMPTGYDYYIFEGGVNDFANSVPMGGTIQLGTLTNSFPTKGGSGDDIVSTTVIGAVEYACRDLVTLFPGKKYGFVFVHGIFPYTGDIYPLWHTQFKPGIKSALEKWGIPYIDLEELAPPLNLIPSLKSAYTASGDGWHPNAAGYAAFYTDKIKAWLETL